MKLNEIVKEVPKDNLPDSELNESLLSLVEEMGILSSRNNNKNSVALKEIAGKVSAKLNKDVVDSILANTRVDSSVIENSLINNKTKELSAFPIVDLQSLRNVADTMGFVIIPWQYLSPSAYDKESSKVKTAISDFVSRKEFKTYVMTPIIYYDVESHIRAKELPTFSSTKCSQVMMSIGMTIPILRRLSKDVSDLKTDVSTLKNEMRQIRSDLTSVKEEVDQMKVQIKKIEQYIQKQIVADMVAEVKRKEEIRNKELIAQAEEYRRKIEAARDPMLIGINCDINDAGYGFVGPCWGGDIDQDIIDLLQLDTL